jgi:hypothetical protein
MHTFEKHGLTIFHNNSLHSTADVHLQKDHGAGFRCPQQALVAFVAELVAGERIGELEQASPLEVFGLGPKLTPELRSAIVELCNAAGLAAGELSEELPSVHGDGNSNANALEAACSRVARALKKAEARK